MTVENIGSLIWIQKWTQWIGVLCVLLLISGKHQVNAVPTFTSPPDFGTVSIPESSVIGTSVVDLVATGNGAITYTVNNVQFTIAATTQCRTLLLLDYETTTVYVIEFEAVDTDPATATITYTVSITDVNDVTPVISGTLVATVDEDVTVGTDVTGFVFNIADADTGDSWTYALSGTDSVYFQIDSTNGVVKTARNLDYEVTTTYTSLTLTVTDASSNFDTAALTINVNDVNDNTPSFNPGLYSFTLSENSVASVVVATLTATDPDTFGNFGTFAYSIASGDDATPKFAILSNTVVTSSNPTDYEALSGQGWSYKLVIHAIDGAPTNTGSTTVVVVISPVNEADPVFGANTPAGATHNILENDPVGTSIVTVAATDADDGFDGVLTYSIISIVDSASVSSPGTYAIDSLSGKVSTSALLDRDPITGGVPYYTVVVQAIDSGTPKRSVTMSLTFSIDDYNDNNPKFSQVLYSVTLLESASVGTNVQLMPVTDGDQSSTITYAITAGNTGNWFVFDGTTPNQLELNTVVEPDNPTNDPVSYSLTITAEDSGTPELTGTAYITVTITPTNDNTPIFLAASAPSLSESDPVDTIVTTVTATDSDYGDQGIVSYKIVAGDTGNNFLVDPTSGVVKIKTLLDFETLTPNPVQLEIEARDGGLAPNSATLTLAITVTDVNDNGPSCTSTSVEVTIAETALVSSTVATLTCTDAESTPTFVISNGDPGNNFAISAAGVITLNAVVDYDLGTRLYSMTVDVSDGSTTLSVPVTVTITAVNEGTPTVTGTDVTVSEAHLVGNLVVNFAGGDSDAAPHDVATYAIQSVSNAGFSLFTIDQNGRVDLAGPLDYEILPVGVKYYDIVVQVTDGGGLQGVGTATVTVSDENDNIPACTPSTYAFSVPENVAVVPSTLVTLGCTDADSGLLGSLVYSISPTTHFTVSGVGLVEHSVAFDYETEPSQFLTITVADQGSVPLATSVVIAITVTDANDGPPVFGAGPFATPVAENVALGHSTFTMAATDPDGAASIYGNLAYVITTGNTNSDFSIDSISGIVKTQKILDFETTTSYELVIEAREQSTDNTATTTLTITVTDVNDNNPTCTDMAFSKNVGEQEAVNFVVHPFACSDLDGDPLTYTITTGDLTKFVIVGTQVQLLAQVDYDLGPRSYALTFTVSDGTNSIVVSGSVGVGASNEATPIFTQVTYSPNIDEGSTVGRTVQTVIANDADSADTTDGQVLYYFVSSYPKFSLDSISGVITTALVLDWETTPSYVLLIRGTDGTNSATATISVAVNDLNDNSPAFNPLSYSGSVSETDGIAASTVVTIIATDIDDPVTNNHGTVNYIITTGGIPFTIGTTTGAIVTTAVLDYESQQSYSFYVEAYDSLGLAGAKTSTVVVTVDVVNSNEATPVFSPTTYSKNVLENETPGTSLITIIASDTDVGLDGEIYYAFSPVSHAMFAINDVTGIITLKAALDFESVSSYSLTVFAYDRGTTPQQNSAQVTVTINVLDFNDETPLCSPQDYTVTLAEDVASTTSVQLLACSDADTGANAALSYAITFVNGVAGAGPFVISGTGLMTVNTALDFEASSNMEAIIVVTDGGAPAKSTTATVNLAVTDINEAPPAFTGGPFQPSISETASVGDPLITMAAIDPDTSETIQYSINPASSEFSVDPTSGIISLKSPLDYETASTYNVVVYATDSGTNPSARSASATVTVTVSDASDSPPVFNPASYVATMSENDAAGTTVQSVTATDPDGGGTNVATYTIFSGNGDSVFRLDNGGSGEAFVVIDAITNLDYETTALYNLVIKATDVTGSTATATVNINVTPYNEASPTFAPSSSTELHLENIIVGTMIVDLDATDSDSGDDGKIVYSIFSGAAGKFSINPSSGVVKTMALLDRETTTSFPVVIHATDLGIVPGPRTGTYSLTISVTDYNDNTPGCAQSSYSSSIPESSIVGTTVLQPVCSDLDDDPAAINNDIAYTITSDTSPGYFTIDVNTGEVTTNSLLDFETAGSYTLGIQLADKGVPSLSTTIQLLITLTDVNDNPPIVAPTTYSPTISEAVLPGTSVTTLLATDMDSGSNGDILYSIISGNGAGHFVIDSLTGTLKTAAQLDRETTPSYSLIIHAIDGGAASLTGTGTVGITVTDANDNAPTCTSAVYTGTLAEDVILTTVATTISCSDLDSSSTVTYSIGVGTSFDVDINTGIVTVTTLLDAEIATEHPLVITATDGTLSTVVTAIITITDVNEATPAFAAGAPYTIGVNEDEAIAFQVFDIDATDTDISDTTLTYTITLGNVGNVYKINPTTGVVKLQGSLNREVTASYSLTIEAADGSGAGSLTATTGLTVIVNDVNDNAPSCPQGIYYRSLVENSPVASPVATIACTDIDQLTPTPFYTITNGNAELRFQIHITSGDMTVAIAPDYETTTEYTIEVTVNDNGTPNLATVIEVQIDITPVNENPPVIAGSYTPSIMEDAAVGDPVTTVFASDVDQGGLHGTIRFSITSGNGLGHFQIDVNSGVLSVAAPLNRELMPSYTLIVTATDSTVLAGDELFDVVTVSITIDDVNDNVPTFASVVNSVNLAESALVGFTVAQFTATDDDAGVNAAILYSITAGNTGSVFNIVVDKLTLAANVDYETISQYSLTIQASDQGATPKVASAFYLVTIVPVNEYTPSFASASNAFSLPETTAVGTVVYSAVATDQDTGKYGTLTYSIASGNTPPSFFMNSFNGDLMISDVLDFETTPVYNLVLLVEDDGDIPANTFSDNMSVDITITDENDNIPIFTMNTYNINLNENVIIGTSVVQVVATDGDSGAMGSVTYSLQTGATATFGIDPAGFIVTLVNIDYEAPKKVYSLTVRATDGGSPGLYSQALVLLTVVDVNDNAPAFEPSTATGTILENQSPGSPVMTVYAVDIDSSANLNNVFTYSTSSTDFAVHPTTGAVTTMSSLNRESVDSYAVVVFATDQGTIPLTGTTTLTIFVGDVNDNNPVVVGSYDTSISEATAVNEVVFDIQANDADLGDNSRMTYSITAGNINNDFKIESASGIIQVNQALDRETTTGYNLEILIIDNGLPQLPTVMTATVTILDENDNIPVFTPPLSFTVAEDVAINHPVGTVISVDPDINNNGALVYDIILFYEGEPRFGMDISSGLISTTSTLDRETIETYVLLCRVSDNGVPQLFSEANVTITVSDINDNDPVFDKPSYNSFVFENTAVGQSIFTMTVSDPDLGNNGLISFTIDQSTPESLRSFQFFDISSPGGEVTVKQMIDRETDAYFTFVAIANDAGASPRSASATITITVGDVNDNTPQMIQSFFNAEVANDADCTDTILTLQATDPDDGVNAQIQYLLESGIYDFLVNLDIGTGVLTLKATADPDTKIVLDVFARDSGVVPKESLQSTVRFDTFVSQDIAVSFELLISKANFELQQNTFITQLGDIFKFRYPTVVVRLWCVTERDGTASNPGGARRLLATDKPVTVSMYVLTDNSTESIVNIGNSKSFMSGSEALSFLASDSSGTPGSAITGSGWDYYSISKVTQYQGDTPWVQTTVGIAVLSVLGFLLLLFIIVSVVVCCFLSRNKKRPVTPMQNMRENIRQAPPTVKPERNIIPVKKHPPAAVVSLPMPTALGPKNAEPDMKSPVVKDIDTDNYWGKRNNFAAEENEYRVQNRDFDGRAVDPATGKLYEYNTKTNERRWLSTPEGKAVKVSNVGYSA